MLVNTWSMPANAASALHIVEGYVRSCMTHTQGLGWRWPPKHLPSDAHAKQRFSMQHNLVITQLNR